MNLPRIITTRVMTRAEWRAIGESVGRELTDEEVVILANTPPLEPPTDLELREMARRHEERVEGRVRQRSEDRFPVSPHD